MRFTSTLVYAVSHVSERLKRKKMYRHLSIDGDPAVVLVVVLLYLLQVDHAAVRGGLGEGEGNGNDSRAEGTHGEKEKR